jgi:holo-[acyl-carrier protein] synthase
VRVEDVAGVLGSAVEVVAISEVAGAAAGTFTEGERAFAESKSDPDRRLAARLAAKRAAARLLGGEVSPGDVEIVRAPGGPPRLRLSPRAEARLRARGAARLLVSLTHGEEHAAASVLLLREA